MPTYTAIKQIQGISCKDTFVFQDKEMELTVHGELIKTYLKTIHL